MAKVLAVLYDDPVDGYPPKYARDDIPKIDHYPGRHDDAHAEQDRLQAGRTARQRLRRARASQVSRGCRPHPGRDLRQGRSQLRLREGASRRRDRHLAAVLARLHDQGALRQGEEAEARRHRRHRLRPYRSPGRHGQGRHRRRGHLLQLDQRLRAHRDDDPGARAQLHPVLRLGDQGRLEHRRLRRALLRSRRHECRHRRRRPHRACRAPASEAVRRQAALLPTSIACRRRWRRSSASPSIPMSSLWSKSATSSPSTRRSIPRPSTCSTTS